MSRKIIYSAKKHYQCLFSLETDAAYDAVNAFLSYFVLLSSLFFFSLKGRLENWTTFH